MIFVIFMQMGERVGIVTLCARLHIIFSFLSADGMKYLQLTQTE